MIGFLAFLRSNARWLAGGFLLTGFSTFGQTSFIALSSGEIRAEFELSHAGFGALYMVATLATALVMPSLGALVDRHPTRRLVVWIIPCLAIAASAIAVADHLAVLLLGLLLLRLFGPGMLAHVGYTASARWFSAQRGRALSFVILGHNAGDALFPVCFVALAGAIGWRNGWLAIAALLVLVALPAILALVAVERAPRSSDPAPRAADAPDRTRGYALRDPVFHLVMLGVIAPAFIVTTIFFHQVHLVELRGWSLTVFASSFGLAAIVNSGFAVVSGQLIDRWSGVRLLPFVLLPLALACFVLGSVDAQWSVFAFMALLGVSNGLSTTLFGVVWPEIYGLKHLGAIRAVALSASVVAAAAGPGATGLLIDLRFGLPPMILVMGAYCLAASAALWAASAMVRRRTARVGL
jgi:MFS family permease